MDLNLPYEIDTRSPLSGYVMSEEAEPREFDPLMTSDGDDKQMAPNNMEGLELPDKHKEEENFVNEECDEEGIECLETRPVCLSMNGRITRPPAEEGAPKARRHHLR